MRQPEGRSLCAYMHIHSGSFVFVYKVFVSTFSLVLFPFFLWSSPLVVKLNVRIVIRTVVAVYPSDRGEVRASLSLSLVLAFSWVYVYVKIYNIVELRGPLPILTKL